MAKVHFATGSTLGKGKPPHTALYLPIKYQQSPIKARLKGSPATFPYFLLKVINCTGKASKHMHW